MVEKLVVDVHIPPSLVMKFFITQCNLLHIRWIRDYTWFNECIIAWYLSKIPYIIIVQCLVNRITIFYFFLLLDPMDNITGTLEWDPKLHDTIVYCSNEGYGNPFAGHPCIIGLIKIVKPLVVPATASISFGSGNEATFHCVVQGLSRESCSYSWSCNSTNLIVGCEGENDTITVGVTGSQDLAGVETWVDVMCRVECVQNFTDEARALLNIGSPVEVSTNAIRDVSTDRTTTRPPSTSSEESADQLPNRSIFSTFRTTTEPGPGHSGMLASSVTKQALNMSDQPCKPVPEESGQSESTNYFPVTPTLFWSIIAGLVAIILVLLIIVIVLKRHQDKTNPCKKTTGTVRPGVGESDEGHNIVNRTERLKSDESDVAIPSNNETGTAMKVPLSRSSPSLFQQPPQLIRSCNVSPWSVLEPESSVDYGGNECVERHGVEAHSKRIRARNTSYSSMGTETEYEEFICGEFCRIQKRVRIHWIIEKFAKQVCTTLSLLLMMYTMHRAENHQCNLAMKGVTSILGNISMKLTMYRRMRTWLTHPNIMLWSSLILYTTDINTLMFFIGLIKVSKYKARPEMFRQEHAWQTTRCLKAYSYKPHLSTHDHKRFDAHYSWVISRSSVTVESISPFFGWFAFFEG